jgi:hypothetical protein
MQKRQIAMQDGRYLIFYTFEDEPPSPPARAEEQRDGSDTEEQPRVKPEATEERNV